MSEPSDVHASLGGALPLPLEGVRVLDATHIVAGPFCSQILADMGAEVIKIERPRTGDAARGRMPFIEREDGRRISSRFLGVNRNKKSVTLDLRNAVCKGSFEKLVANSDVLLDNWGPGAFRRLGLGYDRLSEINPRLIYAEITGYGDGARGPYSDWPANNLAIQAMAGWMDVTGEPGGPPQAVGDNIGDSVPGVWAALGIVLALETRRQTGVGQHVDVAMYECMVSHLISNMNAYQVAGHASGQLSGRTRQASLGPGLALRASDGFVVMAGVRSPQRLAALWALVGRSDLPEQDERYLQQFPDADFVFEQVIPAIEEWSSQRPKWEVAGKFTELGFSMGVAQNVAELADCPQLEARGMYVETGDTLGGMFKSLATPIQLTACRPSDTGTPPMLGEHNSEILCSLGGLTAEQLAELEAEGAV